MLYCRLFGLLSLAIVTVAQAASPQDIDIDGVRVPGNLRTFRWTITNQADQPIVYFRAPRYLSETLMPPDGWEATITTGENHGDNEVVFQARATGYGIYPGKSMTFEIRDTRAERGTKLHKPATIRLSDGTELVIPETPCPGPEPEYLRQLPLIGLGVMFGLFLLWQVLRRKPSASSEPSTGGADNPS